VYLSKSVFVDERWKMEATFFVGGWLAVAGCDAGACGQFQLLAP
jgi:hypothetical protein